MTESAAPKSPAARIAVLVVVIALVIGLFATGAFEGFSIDKTAALIRSYGHWGALVFVLAFTFLQPLGLSGNMFGIVAALVWPTWLALLLTLVGAFGSAMVNVAFVRFVAFEWVQARIPQKFRKYEKWIIEHGLLGVIAFRTLTYTIHPAQLMISVLRIPLPRLMLGTLIGFIGPVATAVLLGGGLTRWIAGLLGVD